MSRYPCDVTNVHVVPQSNECASSGNSTGSSTSGIRCFASSSRSASASRPRFCRSLDGGSNAVALQVGGALGVAVVGSVLSTR
jgi:hypothetical protein